MSETIDIKKLHEISDGKTYHSNDMVKIGCQDCEGCHACCQGMGDSIVLDPRDIYEMTTKLECSFSDFLESCVEFHITNGMIEPNMKMVGSKKQCAFLNEKGRCNIHAIRPGICRLFPLGRCYDEGTFAYFIQVHECKKTAHTKVKIKNWLGIENLKTYEQYICEWHDFQKKVQKKIMEMTEERLRKKANMYVLKQFYEKPYDTDKEFYEQFALRLKMAKRFLKLDKKKEEI